MADFRWAERDSDLDSLRDLPRYKAIMAARAAKFSETDEAKA